VEAAHAPPPRVRAPPTLLGWPTSRAIRAARRFHHLAGQPAGRDDRL